MHLCFNINAFAGKKFKPFPLKPIEIITQAGYKFIELRLDRPYFWLEDLTFERMAEIKSLLKNFELKVTQIGAESCGGYERKKDDVAPPGQRFGPSFSDKELSRRELRIAYTKKAIDFAVLVEAENINTCSGYQPNSLTFEKTWQKVKDGYRVVTKYAQLRDIKVNIEYEPGNYGPGGLFIATAKDTLRMIHDVGAANLGVTLDVGHSFVCGENVVEVIEMLAREQVLNHIHLEDIKDKAHFHLVPGEGDIDFKLIFETLEKVDYQGAVSVELYSLWDKDPVAACQKSYQYLMSNFGKYF